VQDTAARAVTACNGPTADQVTLLTYRTSRIAFRLKGRPELCFSTSQQPTTLCGTAASPASCCNCCLTDTWSTWSWRWLAIAASPSPPETATEAGLRRLKNYVPQGSVLAPVLFNIYLSDLPTTVSRKYAYADDLAITHADGYWQAVEGVLNMDMATVGEYLQIWKLKLSTTKQCRQPSTSTTTRKLNVNLKLNTTTKPCPFAPSPSTSE